MLIKERLKEMKSMKYPLRVQAIREGYYLHQLRRIGDIFFIEKAEDFSDLWMIDPARKAFPKHAEPEFVTANQRGAPSSLTPGVQGRTRISEKAVVVEETPPNFADLKEPGSKGQPEQQPEQPSQQDAQPTNEESTAPAGTGNQDVI